MGGLAQTDQSRDKLSTVSKSERRPSSPENIGFMGVCSRSPGLPMLPLQLESGGVDGRCGLAQSAKSVSITTVGLRASGSGAARGDGIGVITEGPLL
jgi:hypothetical protein